MAEREKRDWTSLPTEILRTILTRFFFGDFKSFRLVCKAWNSVGKAPISPVESPNSQWLMISHYSTKSSFYFYNPLYNQGRLFHMEIPELSNATPECSNHGWVLMSKHVHKESTISVFFFNPFTKQRINLPNIGCRGDYRDNRLCFTSKPIESDCTIFGIYWFQSRHSLQLLYIRHGEEKWDMKEVALDLACPSYGCKGGGIVHIRGLFYVLMSDHNLGIYNPKGSEWRVVDLSYVLDRSYYLLSIINMVECQKQLMLVVMRLGIGDEEPMLCVYSLDMSSKKVLEELTSLNGNMIFVTSHHSTTIAAMKKKKVDWDDGVLEKKIFFPFIDWDDGLLEKKIFFPFFYIRDGIFYSLERKQLQLMYGVMNQLQLINQLYATQYLFSNVWMKPNLNPEKQSQLLFWGLRSSVGTGIQM